LLRGFGETASFAEACRANDPAGVDSEWVSKTDFQIGKSKPLSDFARSIHSGYPAACELIAQSE
jgi:hypothetical protein